MSDFKDCPHQEKKLRPLGMNDINVPRQKESSQLTKILYMMIQYQLPWEREDSNHGQRYHIVFSVIKKVLVGGYRENILLPGILLGNLGRIKIYRSKFLKINLIIVGSGMHKSHHQPSLFLGINVCLSHTPVGYTGRKSLDTILRKQTSGGTVQYIV